jgi:hypothetical protein
MKENSVYINTIASLMDDAGYYDIKDFHYDTINKKIFCHAKTLNNLHRRDRVSWTYIPSEAEIKIAFSSMTTSNFESKKWILRELNLIQLLES